MKKKYKSPNIEVICLDNEISLQLASNNPPVNNRELINFQQKGQMSNEKYDPYQYEDW